MKWIALASLVGIVLVGCAAPSGVTPKPDIRPAIASHQQAQASVKKTQEYVSKVQVSQKQVTADIQKATESLDKYTGASSAAVDSARTALADAAKQQEVASQYADWANTELANAWKYEQDTGVNLTSLSKQINDAHQHEVDQQKWIDANKPTIDQVNKWFGIGAIVYGVKKLAGNLLILGAVLGGLALIAWGLSFAFPIIGVGLGVAFRFIKGVFSRVVNIIRRK